jgi:transposase-like protein
MAKNEFFQAISIDAAPHSSTCEWCSRPAEERLTAIGGTYHNKGGFFCRVCGEEFTRLILNSLSKKSTAPATLDAWRDDRDDEIIIGMD